MMTYPSCVALHVFYRKRRRAFIGRVPAHSSTAVARIICYHLARSPASMLIDRSDACDSNLVVRMPVQRVSCPEPKAS